VHPALSRPALFFGVPLWSYQYTGTFTPQSGAPHGQHESDCNHWFWRPAHPQIELRPYVATQMKTARRAYPRERLPFGSHLYPEASRVNRAVRSCKDGSVAICRSPRSRRLPAQRFTVGFLSSLLFRVRTHAEKGNAIYGRILPGLPSVPPARRAGLNLDHVLADPPQGAWPAVPAAGESRPSHPVFGHGQQASGRSGPPASRPDSPDAVQHRRVVLGGRPARELHAP